MLRGYVFELFMNALFPDFREKENARKRNKWRAINPATSVLTIDGFDPTNSHFPIISLVEKAYFLFWKIYGKAHLSGEGHLFSSFFFSRVASALEQLYK